MPWPLLLHFPQRPDVVGQDAALSPLRAAPAAAAPLLLRRRVLCAHPPRVEDLTDLRAQRLHHDVIPYRPVLKWEGFT